ncbi:MAG TPA: phosphate signaling complex protein PhoU [Treponemataceae bacterium]|nr:phosphate signaling complex protein PhoU [Treponemataceae bacterium]HPS43305.1 phosphate signaling complex protein PhoU [Treponemataceae bacterium]
MTTRTQFSEKLADYYKKIMYMGTLVERYILDVSDAFASSDVEAAKALFETDRKIDELQVEIEQESVMLLLLEAPVARDLRKIVTSIKVVSDLERIGDYAAHLAKLCVKGDQTLYPRFVPRIAAMARNGGAMIRDSLTAYIEDDERLAMETAARDAEIDAQKKQIIAELIMLQPTKEAEMRQIYRYLSISKDLERLGDHITTICEWVIFTVKGEIVDLNRMPKTGD